MINQVEIIQNGIYHLRHSQLNAVLLSTVQNYRGRWAAPEDHEESWTGAIDDIVKELQGQLELPAGDEIEELFKFNQDQFTAMLAGVIELYLEYIDQYGKRQGEAADCAIREVFQGLEAEREMYQKIGLKPALQILDQIIFQAGDIIKVTFDSGFSYTGVVYRRVKNRIQVITRGSGYWFDTNKTDITGMKFVLLERTGVRSIAGRMKLARQYD